MKKQSEITVTLKSTVSAAELCDKLSGLSHDTFNGLVRVKDNLDNILAELRFSFETELSASNIISAYWLAVAPVLPKKNDKGDVFSYSRLLKCGNVFAETAKALHNRLSYLERKVKKEEPEVTITEEPEVSENEELPMAASADIQGMIKALILATSSKEAAIAAISTFEG